MRRSTIAAAALALCSAAGSASAADFAFTGSLFNNNPAPAPNPACAPGTVLLQFNPGNSLQNNLSNFGSFVSTSSHCIGGFPFATWSNGSFLWSFEQGDTLFGTTSGNLVPTAQAGLFDAFYTFVATGGTGRFINATGAIDAVAQVDSRFPPTTNAGVLSGRLNLTAVPEPATWAMLTVGFGLVGGMARRRQRGVTAVRAA